VQPLTNQHVFDLRPGYLKLRLNLAREIAAPPPRIPLQTFTECLYQSQHCMDFNGLHSSREMARRIHFHCWKLFRRYGVWNYNSL